MGTLKRNPLLCILVLVGLVCSLVLLFGRVQAERRADQVACAVAYEDVLLLAQADGRSPDRWLAELSAAGVHYLVLTDGNEAQAAPAAQAAGMAAARAGETAQPGDAFLLPSPPARGGKDYPVPGLPQGDGSVPLALVENYSRTGVVTDPAFDPEAWAGPMVKALYLYDAYSFHYEKSGDTPSENENILFRAVTDRSMRLIILTPLEYEGGGMVTDPAAYRDLLVGLRARLESRGLTLGDAFSAMDAPQRSPLLLAGAALLPAALAVLFLGLILPLPAWGKNALLLLGILIAFGGALLRPALLQTLLAFGTAVLAPCFTGLLFAALCAGRGKRLEALPLPLGYLALLGLLLAISLAGGLTIGALLATRAYLLEFRVFTGVKLAQLLPLAVTAALLFLALRRRPKEERQKPSRLFAAVVILCVAAALFLLVLRSGDSPLPVSRLELAVRTWLEQTLYARPRTKEMLMAFPVLALFLLAVRRRAAFLELPLGVLAAVGSVSVVNTFCHIFTPVHVSLLRTLLSAGIGAVLGLAALGVCALLSGKASTKTTHPQT